MKYVVLILVVLISPLLNSCSTAGRSNLVSVPSNERYYRITFLAYGRGPVVDGEESVAGHASVSIERDGVWGFYPSVPGKLVTKKGKLSYQTEYPRTQEYVDFFVDEQIMNDIWALIHQWENDPPYFAISVNDGVSFIYRVCDIIGLYYDPFALFPAKAIRSIRYFNSHDTIYRTPPHFLMSN